MSFSNQNVSTYQTNLQNSSTKRSKNNKENINFGKYFICFSHQTVLRLRLPFFSSRVEVENRKELSNRALNLLTLCKFTEKGNKRAMKKNIFMIKCNINGRWKRGEKGMYVHFHFLFYYLFDDDHMNYSCFWFQCKFAFSFVLWCR